MIKDEELSTNLTIGDLKTISSIIEACTSRGTFKPAELTIVGTIYEKISSILLSIQNEDQGNKEPGA